MVKRCLDRLTLGLPGGLLLALPGLLLLRPRRISAALLVLVIGGYALYFWYKGKYNPIIGIAGVSCVPTTAKVVQKIATQASPGIMILPHALGANISGVITTAILTGIYVAMLR